MTTRIYTRTGDGGDTGLFGGGRVSKADVRVEAYGTVDELNSFIGWVIAQQPDEATVRGLHAIQADLFTIGAELATPVERARGRRPEVPQLGSERIAELEQWIDQLESALPELRTFILPGGSPVGAALHVARCVCRRAERRVVELSAEASIDPTIIAYLNRLSDLLFVLARSANEGSGHGDTPWLPEPR